MDLEQAYPATRWRRIQHWALRGTECMGAVGFECLSTSGRKVIESVFMAWVPCAGISKRSVGISRTVGPLCRCTSLLSINSNTSSLRHLSVAPASDGSCGPANMGQYAVSEFGEEGFDAPNVYTHSDVLHDLLK